MTVIGFALLPSAASAQTRIGPLTCVNNQTGPGSTYGYTTTTGCTITDGALTGTFCGEYDDIEPSGGSGFTGCRIRLNRYGVDCGTWYVKPKFPDFPAYGDSRDGCTGSTPVTGVQAHCDDETYNFYYAGGVDHYLTCKVGALMVRCLYGKTPPMRQLPSSCRVSLGSAFACDLDLGHSLKSLTACAMAATTRRSG